MFVIRINTRIIILILHLLNFCHGYKPVVLMHGILSGSENMILLQREIEINHPGTKVYNCDLFDGWSSLENAWRQVKEIGDYIMRICDLHPEGIHLLGHSQGGLIGRVILQAFPDHNVHNFISLSSPQAGQYGTDFLHLIFPNLAAKTAFELFYSHIGQYTSVGNYWNDPNKQELYFKYNEFLPYVNNEMKSTNSTAFRNALIKLKKMILIGGPDDGIITPWQSSHFGYYNQTLDVIPFEEREIYQTDAIGLKTLNETERLIIITRPNIYHKRWHTNRKLIHEIILPYLD